MSIEDLTYDFIDVTIKGHIGGFSSLENGDNAVGDYSDELLNVFFFSRSKATSLVVLDSWSHPQNFLRPAPRDERTSPKFQKVIDTRELRYILKKGK